MPSKRSVVRFFEDELILMYPFLIGFLYIKIEKQRKMSKNKKMKRKKEHDFFKESELTHSVGAFRSLSLKQYLFSFNTPLGL
jgi:hypothetical protein